MEDDREIRTMTFNQDGFFSEKVEKQCELCKGRGGKEVKLSVAIPPYIKLCMRASTRKTWTWCIGAGLGVTLIFCRAQNQATKSHEMALWHMYDMAEERETTGLFTSSFLGNPLVKLSIDIFSDK